MKNPNGYGGIIKLEGKRRKPFYARVTEGWEIVHKETGEAIMFIANGAELPKILPENTKLKQIYTGIGSFKTQAEANIALADYNKKHSPLDAATLTFAELYKKWYAWKFNPRRRKQLSQQSKGSYAAAYKNSHELHNMRWLDIRYDHMQNIIWESDKGRETLNNMKNLYSQMYDYAMMNDIGERNYAQYLEIDVAIEGKEDIHAPFDDSERKLLWERLDEFGVDTVLIMIYSGLRPTELCLIETAKIDIAQRVMRGGVKTSAGKDRIIPIHKRILPLIQKRMEEGNKYLICIDGEKISYYYYRSKIWDPLMKQLNLDHLPHDGRHTFGTMADDVGMNPKALKMIIGHSTKKDVTMRYTHKDIEQLKKAIDLIP
ncbi:site-specific recombinase XerD [Desulfitobacterium dehalogenans ATCC 51507]|uniref:Site-specific recombinase XerD n=1 Tax=Desulfitobacterium dehalogenans (strain ATCC 51507 / DSM 9161 / JW/IU-DC1) TaxID=756499 RepID=I4A687_DESDJ|nr:tyrosine-type recombinase/integrase [Desulfitobacterium dehalogenans]AFL99471.1 site-specific recombinase XerD [Desulfitobacterium dehalogenans ATCC 51507]